MLKCSMSLVVFVVVASSAISSTPAPVVGGCVHDGTVSVARGTSERVTAGRRQWHLLLHIVVVEAKVVDCSSRKAFFVLQS